MNRLHRMLKHRWFCRPLTRPSHDLTLNRKVSNSKFRKLSCPKTYIFIFNQRLFFVHRQTVVVPILEREVHQTDTGVDGNQSALCIENDASWLCEVRCDLTVRPAIGSNGRGVCDDGRTGDGEKRGGHGNGAQGRHRESVGGKETAEVEDLGNRKG